MTKLYECLRCNNLFQALGGNVKECPECGHDKTACIDDGQVLMGALE